MYSVFNYLIFNYCPWVTLCLYAFRMNMHILACILQFFLQSAVQSNKSGENIWKVLMTAQWGPMQPQLPVCDTRKATEQVRTGLHEMLWRTGGEGLLEQVE